MGPLVKIFVLREGPICSRHSVLLLRKTKGHDYCILTSVILGLIYKSNNFQLRD